MPDIQKKIKAIRLLYGLTQPQVAELAHLHLRTYQRIESGASAATENMLEALAAAFNCTVDDIRNFDLEANQFGSAPPRLPEIERLEKENTVLKAENYYLTSLLKTTLGDVPGFLEMRGGRISMKIEA